MLLCNILFLEPLPVPAYRVPRIVLPLPAPVYGAPLIPALPAPVYGYGTDNRLGPVIQPTVVIPETVLPEGWDAPLQNPVPRMVPSLPAPSLRRLRHAALYPMTSQPAAQIPMPIAPHPAILLREDIAHRERLTNQQLGVLQEHQIHRHTAMVQE